jgi:predicted nicotinamide N-methyase
MFASRSLGKICSQAPPPHCDLILVGDLFYEKSLAEHALAWLASAESEGIEVLIGDPARSYLPDRSAGQDR